jgi:hypothetical protein
MLLLDTAIAKRIVSLEPLLGPIDLTTLHGPPIDYEGAPRRAHWIDALTGQHGPFLGLSKCIRQDRMARLDWVIGKPSPQKKRPLPARSKITMTLTRAG